MAQQWVTLETCCLVFSSPSCHRVPHGRPLSGPWCALTPEPPRPSHLETVTVDHSRHVPCVFTCTRWHVLILMKFSLLVFFFYGWWFLCFKESSTVSRLQINFHVFSSRSFLFSSLMCSCVIGLVCGPRLEPVFWFLTSSLIKF